MLDGRHLVDAGTDRRVGCDAVRRAIRHVGSPADRFARNHDQAGVEGVDVDTDRVEALVHDKRHGPAMILERSPGSAGSHLEANPPKHERSVGVVLEFVVGIDPAGDPDVGRSALGRNGVCLGDRDLRRGGEQPPDPVRGPERAQDQAAGDERAEARGGDQEGSHGPDDSRRFGGRLRPRSAAGELIALRDRIAE